MWKRFLLLLGVIFIFSCSKKKEPYYLFHIGRDAIVTDSTGEVLRDTFYSRINLGYSYELVKDKDTVFVPRYVTTVDWSRGLKIKMFAGMTAINPKDLQLIMNFSPKRLTYMKGNFQVMSEEFVDVERVEDGYVIFTTMNIYHTDFEGKEKNMVEVYTSKKFYGFAINNVYKVTPEKFLLLGNERFGIYNVRSDSLIVIKPKRPSSPPFYVNGRIYRFEMTVFDPYRARYALFRYDDYSGNQVDSMDMALFNNQYRLKPYVFNGKLYVLTEKAIYVLNPENFTLLKKLDLPVEYDSLWNVDSKFVLYSRKKNQIAEVPSDLSEVKVIAEGVNCQSIYVSSELISCKKGDTVEIYDLSFKPMFTLDNVLFVKDAFVGTREKDTLIIYRKKDTFFKIASPYYSYQKRLQEEEEKRKEKESKE